MSNSLQLSGFIGKVEMTYLSTGKAITKFYVKFYNGKTKEDKPQYAFMNCEAWGDLAEDINTIATDIIYDLEGILKAQSYTDKEGKGRTSYTMTVFHISEHIHDEPAKKTSASPQRKSYGTPQANKK